MINILHAIDHLINGQLSLLQTFAVGVVQQLLHTALAQQCHSSVESDELAHTRHIDTVVVGIAHLRR